MNRRMPIGTSGGVGAGGGNSPGDPIKSAGEKCDAYPNVVVARRKPRSIACSGYHGAAMGAEAVRFLVLWMAGWIHSRQLEVIDFLQEENRVLREQLGGRRLRFTDDQQRRLAVKGRIVGRRRLREFAGLVTPDTILRWYRELIARKYDTSWTRHAWVDITNRDPRIGGGLRLTTGPLHSLGLHAAGRRTR